MGIRRILSINGKEIGANSDVDLANILHQQHNLDRGRIMIETTPNTRMLEGDYDDQALFNILCQLRLRNRNKTNLC